MPDVRVVASSDRALAQREPGEDSPKNDGSVAIAKPASDHLYPILRLSR